MYASEIKAKKFRLITSESIFLILGVKITNVSFLKHQLEKLVLIIFNKKNKKEKFWII